MIKVTEKIRNLFAFCRPVIEKLTELFAFCCPSLVLIGWAQSNPLLTSWLIDDTPMQPNVAVLALLTAAHIMLRGITNTKWVMIGVGVFAFATLMQDLINVDMGIDEILLHPEYSVNTPNAGRASPVTSIAFIICAIGAVKKSFRIAPLVLSMTFIFPFLGYTIKLLTGDSYAFLFTVPFTDTTFMAFSTSVFFLIIFINLITRKQNERIR